MNSKITLIAFLFMFTFLNCKKENSFSNFKHADKPQTMTCDGINSKLYSEAVYTFEDDILAFYRQKNNSNLNLSQAYIQFMRDVNYGKAKYEDIISEHAVEVFKALKNENELWDANNPNSHINYKGRPFKCISNSIADENLKTTFNALISTNSMSPKLFSTPLMSKYRTILKDKPLAAYVALDMYYANLFGIDFTKINFEKPEQKVDFNKLPPKN